MTERDGRPLPEQDDAHELMPQWLQAQMPPLYASENQPDPIARVKYFTPDAGWTWWATEYSPDEELCFGLVEGLETELGYFSLEELRQLRGPMGLRIERDLYFQPTPLSRIQEDIAYRHSPEESPE